MRGHEIRTHALTHVHNDHAGGSKHLHEALGVPVFTTLQGDDIFLDELPTADREKCIQAGASDYIAKPVDMAKASGFLFYNVPNRGNGRATGDAEGHIKNEWL